MTRGILTCHTHLLIVPTFRKDICHNMKTVFLFKDKLLVITRKPRQMRRPNNQIIAMIYVT